MKVQSRSATARSYPAMSAGLLLRESSGRRPAARQRNSSRMKKEPTRFAFGPHALIV